MKTEIITKISDMFALQNSFNELPQHFTVSTCVNSVERVCTFYNCHRYFAVIINRIKEMRILKQNYMTDRNIYQSDKNSNFHF